MVDVSDPSAVCFELPDGSLTDLWVDPPEGARVLVQSDDAGRQVLRHSTAHVLAQAVLRLWSDAKYAGGPPIEDGFYYDFDIGRPFTTEDLKTIEAEMRKIIKENQPFGREEVELPRAAEIFAEQPYKLEWINEMDPESTGEGVSPQAVSLYRNGDKFVDLCRGPHLPSTRKISAFKLMRTSGAYWRGDEKRPMLQRIYGTAWESKDALKDYLRRLEEAEKRDHRKVGRELQLFMTHDLVGTGFPIWLPKGATIRRLLEEYMLEEERRAGYRHVYTPDLGRKELYETSGHWDHFKEDMFPVIELEHEHLVLRPMNCPHHILIYSSSSRSYRELPVRIAELGKMYRYERSGVVGGLSRVRSMTLNDAHIFCRVDQIEEEFSNVVSMVERTYATLGIGDYSYRLSLRDPGNKSKYADNDEMWESGEALLRKALDALGVPYREAPGEAAFYGPKLDIQIRDVLGREETASTIQLDFHLPERFDLHYIGADGAEHRPVMIHRGVIGTLERMVAYLIELYGGAFPTWLAPVQVVILPIAERHQEYAEKVATPLAGADVRLEIDSSNETLGKRIRNAQKQKVPYMLILGDDESVSGSVSVRHRSGVEEKDVPLTDFVGRVRLEIQEHKNG
ncbi:MAG: threonine--tRNA ligase [Actinomycetota bacterium]